MFVAVIETNMNRSVVSEVMAGFLIVHGGHCAAKLLGALKALLTGRHSLSEFFSEAASDMEDCWRDYKAPPMSDQRKDAMNMVNDGVKLYNTKKYEEAIKAFKTAAEYDPTYARAHTYLGNALYKLAEHGDALRCWERAVAVDPLSSAAGKARAKIERVKSQNQMAIRDLHEGLKK